MLNCYVGKQGGHVGVVSLAQYILQQNVDKHCDGTDF